MHPIDWQILSILQEDGKTTYGDLAKRVGLSQAAAHERVKKLEARGVIKGYRAVVEAAVRHKWGDEAGQCSHVACTAGDCH